MYLILKILLIMFLIYKILKSFQMIQIEHILLLGHIAVIGDGGDDRAVILLNSSSSICDDRAYQKTIEYVDDYFPSPMVFVYTLANIVTGEIALRNRYYGETNFYVIPQKDEKVMMKIVEDSFMDEHTTSAICGWLNCDDEDHFEADLYLVEK